MKDEQQCDQKRSFEKFHRISSDSMKNTKLINNKLNNRQLKIMDKIQMKLKITNQSKLNPFSQKLFLIFLLNSYFT
jgi:hypothetical protein